MAEIGSTTEKPRLIFDPEASIGKTCEVIENALVVPFGEGEQRGVTRPAGVFRSNGTFVQLSRCWRSSKIATTCQPTLPENIDATHVAGTHLFGGMLYRHFGHFICESTSRLWALDHVKEPVDGLIFVPKKALTWPDRYVRPTQPMFSVFGLDAMQIQAPTRPVRVDKLIVPAQGFGTGALIAGSPEHRAYIAKHAGQSIEPQGGKKLYISRSNLYFKRGRIMGEKRLEKYLAAEDYEIFHPQEHTIEDQVARYKAANIIISQDCSPLHLACFFASKDTKLAILKRRKHNVINEYIAQYQSFVDITPLVVDAIETSWLPHLDGFGPNECHTEVNFSKIAEALQDNGYIKGAGWPSLTQEDVSDECEELRQKFNADLVEINV